MIGIAATALGSLIRAISILVADRLLAKTIVVGRFRQSTEIKRFFASAADERRALRLFEEIADGIARPLEQFVKAEAGQENAERVHSQLLATLKSMITDKVITLDRFTEHSFDPRQIRASLDSVEHYKQQLDSDTQGFFDGALDLLIMTSAEVLLGLDPFEVKKDKIVLESLGKIIESVDKILDRLKFLEREAPALAEAEEYRFENWYRYELAKSTGSLDLLGIDIPKETRQIPLEVGYITLSFNIAPRRGSTEPRNVRADSVLSKCISSGHSMLIRGEAGSGKTTLAKWLTYQLAVYRRMLSELTSDRRDASERELSDLSANLLPFLVQLRHVGDRLSMDSLLERCAFIGKPPRGWLTAKLESGAVVVLDGIDEIAPAQRNTIRSFVEHLTKRYEKTIVVATTRPTAVDENWLLADKVLEVTVNPLADADKFRLIDHWHVALTAATGSNARANSIKALRLRNLLEKDQQLSGIAASPLLCSAICALHYNNEGHLPHRLNSLCESLIRMLLDRRDQELGIASFSHGEVSALTIDYDRKRIVVAEIADYMVRNHVTTIDTTRMAEIIQETFRLFYGVTFKREFVTYLLERSGLLREERYGRVEFIHASFRDYLAATRLASRKDYGFLSDRAFERDWQNVVLFACGAIEGAGSEEVLGPMITRYHAAAGDAAGAVMPTSRSYGLFILRCASVALELSPALQEEVKRISSSFLPPRDAEEAHVVAIAGDEVASQLQANESHPITTHIACIRALGTMRSHRAMEVMKTYIADERPQVREELVRYINPLEFAGCRRVMFGRKRLPDYIASRVVDLNPLRVRGNIRSLDLTGCYIVDLSELCEFTNLEWLNLSSVPAVNFGPVALCTKLKYLNLSFSKFEDGAILGNLSDLETLRLDYTEVSDIQFARFLPKLNYLSLINARVPPKSARQLSCRVAFS